MVVSAPRPLTRSEMTENANYIYSFLSARGWTKESIAGMLGNMETESTINPGRWQNDFEHPSNGFGLVQWTPSTNYTAWATNNGYEHDDIDGQLIRLDYEIDNGLQWIPTSSYPMSFAEFKVSTRSPEELAQAFLLNYERPQNQNQPSRSTQARNWFDTIEGGGGTVPDGVQLAEMPIDYIHITQGEFGEFMNIGTHNEGTGQELAIDFIFPMNRYPLFAPFDIEVMRRDDNYATVVWKNLTPVIGVDGTIYDELHIIVIHDDNWRDYSVGDRRLQGEHFGNSGNATGNYGISTGDHFHFEVMRGHTYQFPPSRSNQLSIYDVFSITEDTVIAQGRGYNWRIFTGEIPGGGGDDGKSDSSDDIIHLLLSGALHGW